jgi:dTMP kinase
MAAFITFEGIEGCGKTTQIRLLSAALTAAGKRVVLTREPGGCPIADKIRAILLDADNSAMTPSAELLLYAAARAQHVQEVIEPALSRGEIVLCDRFTDATLAYQGYGRGLDKQTIGDLNHLAASGRRPDLTILLDCPVETGLHRAIARIEAASAADRSSLREERFERESRQFHQRVRDGYLDLAAREPDRFIVIPGDGTVEETAAAITGAVAARTGLGG